MGYLPDVKKNGSDQPFRLIKRYPDVVRNQRPSLLKPPVHTSIMIDQGGTGVSFSNLNRFLYSVNDGDQNPNISQVKSIGHLAVISTTISAFTIPLTIRQTVNLAKISTPISYSNILLKCLPNQTVAKTFQLSCWLLAYKGLVNVGIEEDVAKPISFVFPAIPFQTWLYNNTIGTTNEFVSGKALSNASVSGVLKQSRVAVVPSAIREFGATGMGFALTPRLKSSAQQIGINTDNKLISTCIAFSGGVACASMTQWLHNTAFYISQQEKSGRTIGMLSAINELVTTDGVKNLMVKNLMLRAAVIAGVVGTFEVFDLNHLFNKT